MKTGLKYLIIVVFAATMAACTSSATEKKIAELESRLDALEANKGTNPTPSVAPGISATPTTTTPVEDKKPEGPLPVIEFDNIEHDFGTVSEGQKVVHIYKVKNTGAAPLIIQNAQPSCGCTVPDWTKAPIPVGGSGFVKAEFDTKGKQGVNNKVVTVTANTWPKTVQLKFKAMVTPRADGANGPVN